MSDLVLFVADPPEGMDPAADSTYAMITEALRRGLRPEVATLAGLRAAGPRLWVHARPVAPTGPGTPLTATGAPRTRPVDEYRVVFMRKDPPVDDAYLTATWLLELAPDHVPVFNAPAGLRALSEKLSILHFSDITPATHIARDEADLRDQSPITHADKIRAALFLVHGGEDQRVPIEHYKRFTARLEELGKPYESLVKPKEAHGFYDEDNREELYERLLAFFDRHIGPKAADGR